MSMLLLDLMKKFIVYNVVSFAIGLVCIFVAAQLYLNPKLQELIVSKGTEILGTPLALKKVETRLYPNLKVELYELAFVKVDDLKNKVDVKVDTIEVTLNTFDFLKGQLPFKITAYKPTIVIHKELTVAEPTADQIAKLPPPQKYFDPIYEYYENQFRKKPLALDIEIIEGHFTVSNPKTSQQIKDINLKFEMSDFFQPFILNVSGRTQLAEMNFPFEVRSTASLAKSKIVVSQANAVITGVPLTVRGEFDLNALKHSWTVSSHVTQLQSLNIPASCLKLNEGSIDIQIKASTGNYGFNWEAEGTVAASKIKGQSECEMKEIVAKGPISLDSDIQFTFNKQLTFQKLKIAADLDQTQVAYKGLFRKNVSKKLNIDLAGAMENDVFTLQSGRLELDRFIVKSYGKFSSKPGGVSEINSTLSRASLQGIQEFFPIFEGHPVQGELELSSTIKGDFSNPQSLDININPLKAQNVKATLTWANANNTMTMRGPISLNLNGVIRAQGQKLSHADIVADMNLSDFDIKSPNFVKASGIPLLVKLAAKQQNNKIQIKNGELKLPGGSISLNGTISGLGRPLFDLYARSNGIQIEKLLSLFPTLPDYKVPGLTSANLKIYGNYDFAKGIEKSFITVSGQATAKLGQVIIPQANTEAPTSAPNVPSEPPAALAPDWPIVKNLNLTINSKIDSFKYGTMTASGLDIRSTIKDGFLQVIGRVQNIFGGFVQLKKFKVSLVTPAATSDIDMSVKNFQIGPAVNWKFPQWKDLVSGNADGVFTLKIPHHDKKDFLKDATANGNLNIRQGFLSTFSFDRAVNDRISKIPVISDPTKKALNLNSKGATANISTVFNFLDGKLNFANLNILTPEKNELQATGSVSVDKNIDMKGKVFIVNAPVRGTIAEANSDPTGRLIVPVKITGHVMSPDLNLSDETVSTMSQNALKLEGKKLERKVGDELKRKATEELKKLFK